MRQHSRLVIVALAALCVAASAQAASAATIDFNFSDLADGVVASGTLDVVGGQAIAGAGTVTSPFWTGPDAITLVTLSTPGVHDLGGGNLSYRFGGGTDLIGDTTVPVDGQGLVFSVATNPNLDAGLNIWSNGGGSYTAFLAGNAPVGSDSIIYNGYNGSFTTTVAAVPEPAAWAMMLLGVGFIGAGLRMARRKNDMALTAA